MLLLTERRAEPELVFWFCNSVLDPRSLDLTMGNREWGRVTGVGDVLSIAESSVPM